jgi:hypothetical protein
LLSHIEFLVIEQGYILSRDVDYPRASMTGRGWDNSGAD